MISKPHRNNTDFQLKHFFVGSCHTPDGAWALLYSEKVALEGKLANADAQRLRREAKIAAAEEVFMDPKAKKSDLLNAEADRLEALAEVPIWEKNLEAAKMELATITGLMAQLEPLRKYAHLPLLEATEACQEEEWRGELIYRAENFMLTQGNIPHDHFARMREHPKFQTEILPRVNHIRQLVRENRVEAILNSSDRLLLK